jgi:hypothetical protein
MGRLIDKGDIRRRAAERRAARGLTRAWVFDYEIGEVLHGEDGEMYVITELPEVEWRDRVVMVQRLVCDRTGQPVRGLREGQPFVARATRDGVRVDQGRLARRIPPEAVCAG